MKIAYYLPSLQAPGGIERIVTFKANYLQNILKDTTSPSLHPNKWVKHHTFHYPPK
jgi:hypothetical protein